MKWESMTLRDRIAARIYVSTMHTTTKSITFVPKAWAGASTPARKKCRSCAKSILEEIGVKP